MFIDTKHSFIRSTCYDHAERIFCKITDEPERPGCLASEGKWTLDWSRKEVVGIVIALAS